MKLFIKPGSCSLASHIALREVGADFDIDPVDFEAGQSKSGVDYSTINPKGYVPALQLDSGDVLTEGASILQYIADQHPEKDLAPVSGTLERARLQEHLNYTSTELHKAFGPLFAANTSDEAKETAKGNVAKKLDYVNTLLKDKAAYLLGDTFSVADAYLFVVCNWANFVGIDLKNWPNIVAYSKRVSERPSVQNALKAEGLAA
jgi:glutathione S-transferase